MDPVAHTSDLDRASPRTWSRATLRVFAAMCVASGVGAACRSRDDGRAAAPPAQARAALVGVQTATARGSGFFVAPGWVVTASALVLDDAEVHVERAVGAPPVRVVHPETKVLAVDPEGALALVRIHNLDAQVPVLALAPSVPPAASVVSAWSFAPPKDAELRVVGPRRAPITGPYTSGVAARADTEVLEVRGKLRARHVGGPVVDAQGRVVGVVTRAGRSARVAPVAAVAALLAQARKAEVAPTAQEVQRRVEALWAHVVHADEAAASAVLEVHVAPAELRAFVAPKAELLGRARRCLPLLAGQHDGDAESTPTSVRRAQIRTACFALLGAYTERPEGRCVLERVREAGPSALSGGAWKTCLRQGVPRAVQQMFRWLFEATPSAPARDLRVLTAPVAEGRAGFWRVQVSWRTGDQPRSDTLLLQRDRGQLFVRTTGFGGRPQGALASGAEAMAALLTQRSDAGGVAATAPSASTAPAVVTIVGGRYVPARGGAAVTVSSLGIDATEVTVDAYRACVAAQKCEAPSASASRSKKGAPTVKASPPRRSPESDPACNGPRGERGAQPINCIAAPDAERYCRWRGGRLPTEDEWEWVARGREQARAYPWGAEAPGAQLCWSGAGNGGQRAARTGTCAVGSHPSGHSRDGVADLAGNVWEWTATQFGRLRVYRGGSWTDSGARVVSVAGRSWAPPAARLPRVGFRCVYAR